MTLTDMPLAINASMWLTAASRIFTVVIIPFTVWAFGVLVSVEADIKSLATTVNFLVQDRYRADEARRDFQLRDLRLDTIEKRMTDIDMSLERRIVDLEHAVRDAKQIIEQVAPVRRRQPQ